ncbi:MAG TPA: FAD-binding oxidoreductase [Solirubrobacteraceae bacterium]
MAIDRPSGLRREISWSGWGDPAVAAPLPEALRSLLRGALGIERPGPPVPPLEDLRLAPARLPDAIVSELAQIVGAAHARADHEARARHARGKSTIDLLELRAGGPLDAPDLVVDPASHDEVQAVLDCCSARRVAVIPFGGGTSVVGGLHPDAAGFTGTVALDVRRMDALVALDEESRLAVLEPGLRGPEAEALVGARGYTLGHFPQSWEYATLGGFAAARSSGQSSAGYGRFDERVMALRVATPAGTLALGRAPRSAAGPDLRQLLLGSEGTLGVISELSLRVREAPRERIFDGVFFGDFAAGAQAMRELIQSGAAPHVARLSDEAETRMSLALAGTGGLKGRLGRAYLRARGYGDGCLAIFGYEGSDERQTRGRRERGLAIARDHGGLPVGHSPGEAWLKGRFEAPYLRDDLLTQGVLVETLETATRWSNVQRLHGAVTRAIEGALRDRGTPGLVMCHISHLYETGASLYFTFIARQQQGEELAQWRSAKEAASRAITESGGTITHHHAVGRDHAPWMAAEVGERGLGALRAVKAELDPAGIMNPGKLFAG